MTIGVEICGVTTGAEIHGVTTGVEICGVTTGVEICGVTTGAEIHGVTTGAQCCWEVIDKVPHEVNARKVFIVNNASLTVTDEMGAGKTCAEGNGTCEYCATCEGVEDDEASADLATSGTFVGKDVLFTKVHWEVPTVVITEGMAVTNMACIGTVCVVPSKGVSTKTPLRGADFTGAVVAAAPPDVEHSAVGCSWNGPWPPGCEYKGP